MDTFGPGVLAALCGARADNSSGNVWFFPKEKLPLHEIHVKYDPECALARRIKDIYRAGLAKWNGSVLMGMVDLGGVLDVAATFRGSEELLCDFYDDPEGVLLLIKEIENAWYAAYDDFSEVLAPQKYHTDWSGLISRGTSYIPQCDLSYMIGPDMFREFVPGTLKRDSERLSHTIYHLDGIGELPHLDALLELPRLDAVQWVSGEGKPLAGEWLDVFRRIDRAGKRAMVTWSAGEFLDVVRATHLPVFTRAGVDAGDTALINALLTAR